METENTYKFCSDKTGSYSKENSAATASPKSINPADFKILLVDDESDLLEYFSFIIERVGYKVETASGGNEAFKKFEAGAYDMVITDIRMPQGDGVSLIKNIRNINKSTPVFCVTGFSEITSAQLLDLGANAVFEKPINREKVLNQIQQTFSTAKDS
jgi:two-component system response regulator HydG